MENEKLIADLLSQHSVQDILKFSTLEECKMLGIDTTDEEQAVFELGCYKNTKGNSGW